MPKYKVKYSFDGNGEVIIKAKNKQAAEKLFREGGYDDKTEKEWRENFVLENINFPL